eukprot:7567212-Karenia_brevis.AAC.1
MFKVFDRAQKIAGLALGPAKCVLVPLGPFDFSAVKHALGAWLDRWVPEWATFKICPSAEYLGVEMGPGAMSKQWNGVEAEARSRVS